jgi:hypothetical protein
MAGCTLIGIPSLTYCDRIFSIGIDYRKAFPGPQ